MPSYYTFANTVMARMVNGKESGQLRIVTAQIGGGMDISIKDLDKMSAMGFDDVCAEEVPMFGELRQYMDISPADRVRKVLETGRNPYFRRSKDGKILVKISFANNGVRFADALASALNTKG